MQERCYTTHEASRFCNVYPTTVIKWIEENILPAFTTPGGHRRIKRSDLVKLMQKNNMPVPEELLKADKTRILVIDDDLKIIRMIKTILEAENNLEVATAKDGFAAGVLVAEWSPDIILLDILMPKIDGFEVCRRIRQNKRTKDIPIIAVTVLRNEQEIKKMQTTGFTDYLAKPFKSQALIEKVNKYLPAGRR